MAALAESSLDQPSWRVWLVRALVALVLACVLVALGFGLKSLLGGPTEVKRQTAKIAILPDTPPPPPPPKQEKPPEPQKQELKQMQQEQVKPIQPPQVAEAPIKMEGEAGNGPSAFSAGSVAQEYQGGTPTVGASGVGGTGVDRANERLYANTARQMLRDELQRQIGADAGELTATLAIWIEPDGQIRRFELQGSDRPERDTQMRVALEAVSRGFRLPPPPPVAQPMRFRVTLRPQG